MAKGLHGQARPPEDPAAGVTTVLLVIAFVVILLWLPGLRDFFNTIADLFSAR